MCLTVALDDGVITYEQLHTLMTRSYAALRVVRRPSPPDAVLFTQSAAAGQTLAALVALRIDRGPVSPRDPVSTAYRMSDWH